MFTTIIRKPKVEPSLYEIGEETLKQLRAGLNHLNISFTRDELKALFALFDSESNGMIDIEEFITALEGTHLPE